MDHPDDGSSSSSIGGCSGGGTSKSSVTVGGGTVSGSLNRLFMKPTSKSAPSSPPITTVTAASPEPPPIAPVPASGTICDSTAVAVTTSEATGSDSQFVKSSVSVSTSTTALQRLNNHSNNNNNTSGTSQQEQTAAPTPVTASASVPAATVTATATAAVFNRPYPASSPGSTPDHPATLSPTSPVSQRLGSGHTTTQYLGQHRSSMQYIQTPGAGGGGGGGVGGGGGITGRSVGDGPNSGTTGSVFISRRRGSSNAGPGDRGGSTSSMVGTSGTIRRKSREFVPGPIRRASQVLISLTSPDGASLYGECSRRDSRAVPQITLMSSTFQRLPMKDFGAEVRASMDVDQFLQQAVLLLDVNETSLEGIVDRIVKKVSLTMSTSSIRAHFTCIYVHFHLLYFRSFSLALSFSMFPLLHFVYVLASACISISCLSQQSPSSFPFFHSFIHSLDASSKIKEEGEPERGREGEEQVTGMNGKVACGCYNGNHWYLRW